MKTKRLIDPTYIETRGRGEVILREFQAGRRVNTNLGVGTLARFRGLGFWEVKLDSGITRRVSSNEIRLLDEKAGRPKPVK